VNAVAELYQVPLEQFVAERKRLAKESGDKSLLERRKPSISAWVVNQLYWHARDAFDRMMETADQLRKGKLDADKPHRDAIAKLRQRASTILEDAGHAASEGVLRRVTTTLSALAAAGGWEPSEPGALAYDLDPPGFGALGISAITPDEAPPKHEHHPKKHDGHDERERAKRETEEARRRAAAREKLEQQLERARAHADNVAGEAKVAGKEADKLEREAVKAREHAGKLEDRAAEAREEVERLERDLRELG
jgi:DNA repair exonuclease SbcCD ATPase subunit